MPSMFDVKPEALVIQAAQVLKQSEQIKPPQWAAFVKTGMHKERPPQDPDWWYTRSAAVLRKIRVRGPIGVSKLRRAYGGKKNRGNKPEHFYKGSGNILRKVLQQLEKAGLARQVDIQGRKGRVITPKGVSLLDKAAQVVLSKSTRQQLVPKIEFVEKPQRKSPEKIVEELVKKRLQEKPVQPREQKGKKGRR